MKSLTSLPKTKLLSSFGPLALVNSRNFANIPKADPSLFPITVVGSYPQPKGLEVPSWFGDKICQARDSLSKYTEWLANQTEEVQNKLNNAFNQVINEQISHGVDLPTDGELNRENYIFHHCRHLNGFDFDNPVTIYVRNMKSRPMEVPIINEKVTVNSLYLGDHWKKMQEMSSKPLKVTIPGPMTIADTSKNEYYQNQNDLYWDLACAINEEILQLKDYGIKYIQIDEPVWGRYHEKARDIGFDCMNRCFKDIKDCDNIYRSVHICRGYFTTLDDTSYVKSSVDCYVKLAEVGMDNVSSIDGISVEDAYERIPLEYFKLMKTKDFILGCVTSVTSYVHNKDEIFNRVNQIINECNINPSRIILSSDCGLAMLPVDIIKEKLTSMKDAKQMLNEKYLNLQSN